MTAANAVSPARGSHGALDRHAVMFDFVSSNSRMNNKVRNAMIPTDADPIWTCHPWSLFILCPSESITSGNMLSMEMKAQAPPNTATSNVAGV